MCSQIIFLLFLSGFLCNFFNIYISGSRWRTKDLTYTISKYPKSQRLKKQVHEFSHINSQKRFSAMNGTSEQQFVTCSHIDMSLCEHFREIKQNSGEKVWNKVVSKETKTGGCFFFNGSFDCDRKTNVLLLLTSPKKVFFLKALFHFILFQNKASKLSNLMFERTK